MKIILGSASPRRAKLMTDWGYDFDVMIPRIDEKSIRSDDYRLLPRLIAQAKSDALKKEIQQPAILITCDTIVLHDGQLYEKPNNDLEAWSYLNAYGQKPAEVICGVVVTNTKNGKSVDGIDAAKVYFHKLPQKVIEELVDSGLVFDWAGAFHPAHPAIQPHIAYIEGEVGTVMGLPKLLTKKLIDAVNKE